MLATGILAVVDGGENVAAEVGNDPAWKKVFKSKYRKNSFPTGNTFPFYLPLSLFFNPFLHLLHPRPNTIIPATRIRKR